MAAEITWRQEESSSEQQSSPSNKNLHFSIWDSTRVYEIWTLALLKCSQSVRHSSPIGSALYRHALANFIYDILNLTVVNQSPANFMSEKFEKKKSAK